MDEYAFHDGHLDGLLVSKSDAKLFLSTSKGKQTTLVLRGLYAIVAQDMRQGNIILSLEFMDLVEVERDQILMLYHGSEEQMKKVDLEQWRKRAADKRLRALQISPSYGCSLFAIFEDHEFLQGYLI